MANRTRTVQLHFMVTEREREQIRERMAKAGINNLGAFLRKMALDGYVVKLDLPELREIASLLRVISMTLTWRRYTGTKSSFGEALEKSCLSSLFWNDLPSGLFALYFQCKNGV